MSFGTFLAFRLTFITLAQGPSTARRTMPTDPRNVNRRKRIDCLDVGDAMGGKRKARIDTRPCARTAILASASPRGYRTLLVQLASSNVSIPRTARAGAGKTLPASTAEPAPRIPITRSTLSTFGYPRC